MKLQKSISKDLKTDPYRFMAGKFMHSQIAIKA